LAALADQVQVWLTFDMTRARSGAAWGGNICLEHAEVFVTNLKKRFTGVSATAAGVLGAHQGRLSVQLVGRALPGVAAPIGFWRALWQSRRPPAQRRFSIWHTRRNNELFLALFARDILRFPIKVVFTSASMRPKSRWPLFMIGRADAVIAVTKAAAAVVPNVWAVAPHGVDTARFKPSPDRAAHWAASGFGGGRGVAVVGRIRPEKGTDIFVDAMIAALPLLPDVTALIIGLTLPKHRVFQTELQARIDAAGLGARILFIGEISQPKLASLLPGLDLLIAVPLYEGYGMTPLEAMSCAVPVVASDAGFYRQFIGEGDHAGRIVPVAEPKATAEAVVDLLTNPAAQVRACERALERARGPFSIETEASAIAAVYARLWAGE
jgi:mannosyltransferase